MKILIASDSYKGSLSSLEISKSIQKGFKEVFEDVSFKTLSMADGGEGTMQSLVDATGGRVYSKEVVGPLGNNVVAEYGILGNGEIGVIEMASASGIHLVDSEKRNPLITTTFGTGQLIKACLDKGVKKLLIGIGGSATNDGGAGFIQALGGRLLDENGDDLSYGGGALAKLHTIDLSNLDERLKYVSVEVACDVNNPLCGKEGASYVFGPQKGATREMIEILDQNLSHYAEVIKEQLGKDVISKAGAGAAGGLGAGLMAFLDVKLKSGIEMVIEYANLEEKVRDADMVWTGEGSIDFQTQYGKTPLGVAMIAKKYNKPVIALAGRVGNDIDVLYDKGIDAIFGIMRGVTSIEEALVKGPENVEKTSENIIRLLNISCI